MELSGSVALTELTEEDIRAELAALVTAGVVPTEILGNQDEQHDDDISDLV